MTSTKRIKCILANSTAFFLATMLIFTTALHADGFIKEGVTVLLGRGDTVFKVCNKTGKSLRIAIIYKHHWKFGEPPTWPVKGWFDYAPGDCAPVAVNEFVGVMSVVTVSKDGELVPYYSSKTPFEDLGIVNYNETKSFATEYFCLGEAPFDDYRDSFIDYRNCKKGQTKTPFNVMFSHGGRQSYTLSLQ